MQCPNCGAAYNPAKYKCEYCGSFVFMNEDKQFNVPESVIQEISTSSNTPGIYVYGSLLGKGEIPLRLGLANYYTSKFMGVGGKFLLTKTNLYFSSHKVFQNKINLQINLLDITKIEQGLNLLISQHILIHTNEKIYRFVVYGGKEWLNMIESAIKDFTPSSTDKDYTAELVRLKQLLDKGIITEDEFTIKKRMLLGI